jgi:hypothetical protein
LEAIKKWRGGAKVKKASKGKAKRDKVFTELLRVITSVQKVIARFENKVAEWDAEHKKETEAIIKLATNGRILLIPDSKCQGCGKLGSVDHATYLCLYCLAMKNEMEEKRYRENSGGRKPEPDEVRV